MSGRDDMMAALASASWHRTRVTEAEHAEGVPPSVVVRPLLLVRWWRWFLGSESEQLSPWRTILWWEARRLPYNVLLAVFGSVGLLVFFWAITQSGGLKPGEDAAEPLVLLAAPVLANVAYTLGWIAELAASVVRRSGARLGPGLLRVGLGVSAFVVLEPAVYWVGRLILR